VVVQDDLDEEDFHNVPNSELNHSIENLQKISLIDEENEKGGS